MEEDIETDDSTTDDDDDNQEMHLVGVAAEEPAMTEDIADSMARAETAAELDEQLGGVDELDTELGRNDAYEQTLEMDAADDEEPVGGVTWAVEGNGSDDDDDMVTQHFTLLYLAATPTHITRVVINSVLIDAQDDEELGTPEHDEF
mmetsp:Transcript_59507/g.140850  ORF Transcript_59507/g.140850 Transcript_59507/m.140850 type:complete len:147 (+) Transcript_59507:1222-1662(+)